MILKKATISFLTAIILLATSSACASGSADETEYFGAGDQVGMTVNMEKAPQYIAAEKATALARKAEFPDSALESDQWNMSVDGEKNYVSIFLGENGSFVSGEQTDAVTVDNETNTVKITKAGYYQFIGSTERGNIIVDCEGNVRVILDGVSIKGKDGATIRFYGYGQKVLTLAENKSNFVYAPGAKPSNGASDDVPACAIYSESDLTVNGDGSGSFIGNNEGAIVCRSTLKIKSASVEIKSKSDAVTANNAVFKNATVAIESTAGTAVTAKRRDMLVKEGFVVVSDASVRAVSACDAIKATDLICVNGSTSVVSVCSGNGSSSVIYDEIYSRKGLNCDGCVCIMDGALYVDSLDDAIRAKEQTLLGGGFLSASTKKAAIFSDLTEFRGCIVEIARSGYGVKGCNVSVVDGLIKINANQIGINLSSAYGEYDDCALVMSGGSMDVFSRGEGIRISGKMLVNNGSLWCDSSLAADKPAVAADEGFRVDGGRVMLCAGSGMIQTPAIQSAQGSVAISFKNGLAANSTVSLKYDDVVLFSREMINKVGSLFFSCPNFSENYACSLEINGYRVRKFVVTQGFSEQGVA